jgi:antitoxin component HigA of HigAB toxin-antitoxin module
MPGRFNELVAMMPPRVIHDDIEYRHVLDMLDAVLARPRLTKGQTEYVETWAVLVESYEREHHGIDDEATPVQSLQYLLDEACMSASDLGRLLGNRSLGSAILNGQRALSKTHIRTLADHFKVEPGLFMDVAQSPSRLSAPST